MRESNSKISKMPKLNKAMLPKVVEGSGQHRKTNLKLDPIEEDHRSVGQSMQFQKGMLSPIDGNNMMHNNGPLSPKMKKTVGM